MTKEQLINKYENMMYKYGEYDVWEDDVAPKLNNMKIVDIEKQYKEDKKFYEARELAGGRW